MKAKDIKVGHVYFVNFDPVEPGEFDRNHLALVLKKNSNRITFVVIPLTHKDKGLGINKIELDIKGLLPPHLRSGSTFAVYDQIRTVNASRFELLYEGPDVYDVSVPQRVVTEVIEKVILNLLEDLDESLKSSILDGIKN